MSGPRIPTVPWALALAGLVAHSFAFSAEQNYIRIEPDSTAVQQDTAAGETQSLTSEFPNIRVYYDPTVEQTEMSIAVNSGDPKYLLIGANTISGPGNHRSLYQGTYWSSNSGATWLGNDNAPPSTPTTTISGMDPAVCFGAFDDAYFSNLVQPVDSSLRVALWHTTSLQSPAWTTIGYVNGLGTRREPDKPHVTADTTHSQFRGDVYVAYTEFGIPTHPDTPATIQFTRYIPGGSLQASIPISGQTVSAMAQGVCLAVGPSGDVYAVWACYDVFPRAGGREVAIGFTKLTRGGDSLVTPIRIPGLNVKGIRGYLKLGGTTTVRVNSFPAMAVDNSLGPHRGTIYEERYTWSGPTGGGTFLMALLTYT